jgi:diaminopimelate epimerase
MRIIPFVKMSGAGNDFMMIDNRGQMLRDGEAAGLARAACPRRTSAGADGLILIEKASQPGLDYRMRIFNADGSEAEMCGNGSRCAAVFARLLGAAGEAQKVETLAGSLNATAASDGLSAKVQLSPPSKLEINKNAAVSGRKCDLFFINTGVPHAIQFVADVSKVDVKTDGACIRYHELFKPKGANADFVQVLSPGAISLRTYERGVEDETFACGTGAAAAALVTHLVHGHASPIKVKTAGNCTLTIHFARQGDSLERPFLEGPVATIYKGEFFWGSGETAPIKNK